MRFFLIIIKYMSIKEYIIENKVKIGAAILGLAAVGGLIYFFTRGEKPKKIENKQPQTVVNTSKLSLTSTVQNEDNQQEIVQDPYNKKLIRIINQIKKALQKSGDLINQQVITLIVRGQYALSNSQIKAAVQKSRKQRRSKIKDTLEYARIVTKHQLELQEIQQKYLGLILARFGIDKVSWSQANHEWQQKAYGQNQGISDLIGQEEKKLLLSLRKSNKTIPFKQIEQILNYKIDQLKKLDIHQLGFDIGSDQASKYQTITTYISDLIYRKFKVQVEDIEYSIEQLQKDFKLQIIKLEDTIAEVMQGLIGSDDGDQEQQDDRGSQHL